MIPSPLEEKPFVDQFWAQSHSDRRGILKIGYQRLPERIKALLKLAADNNLEIKLATSWENQRIGLVKTESEKKSLEGKG